MSTFSEYAALARQLADQRRETDQDAAAEAGRRHALHASADQLAQRLAGQSQRLGHLGRALGLPDDPPPGPSGDHPGPAVPASIVSGPGPSGGRSGGAPGAGAVVDGGAAAAPGRSGVGAYPPGTAGGALVALPTAAGVPAPRAGGVDPVAELTEARRLADEADRLFQVTEAVARHPPLLPTWSPLSRALAVYAGCAAAGILLALVMLKAAGLGLGAGVLYTATCAGLPVLSFVAGYLVLGRWGRPVLGGDAPQPRFVPLGFVTCVLLVPLAQCGYLVLVRLTP
ncbi:hypothetical protein [Micromonospora sp. RTGN7]|uniref:hypothetical protein n=1 Tax=Micromonospora sp. RTGN7 TaxID=3016526 RepID=UPI0029FED7E7|nr:hypothetical protein [Micromonospora sp. RTGN7]